MVTSQIIEYIKTQLQSGQSPEQIKESLFQSGWQSVDIEAAFVTITPTTPQLVNATLDSVPVAPSKKKLHIVLGILFVVIAALAVAAYMIGFPATSQSLPAPTPKTSLVPTQSVATPTLEVEKNVDTAEFVDSTGVFAFDYIKTWKIQSQETMALLSNPQNSDTAKCDGALENFEFCDAIVSSVPYAGVSYLAEGVTVSTPPEPSHEEQVKQLVAQLGTVENESFTNGQGLKGYIVKTSVPEAERNTYNFLFEGANNMILVQMPIKVGESVSEEHKVIIQSIKEP